MRRTCCILVLLLGCSQAPPSEPSKPKITISLSDSAFDVTGIDSVNLDKLANIQWQPVQWQTLFKIQVGRNVEEKTPCILGTYRISKGRLQFESRYRIEPGLSYRAQFDPTKLPVPSNQNKVVQVFEKPREAAVPSTVVSHVYPSMAVLPENQLKFYICFSAPMSRGDVYRCIHLLDESGKEVKWPFLELDEELWDATGTRFTALAPAQLV